MYAVKWFDQTRCKMRVPMNVRGEACKAKMATRFAAKLPDEIPTPLVKTIEARAMVVSKPVNESPKRVTTFSFQSMFMETSTAAAATPANNGGEHLAKMICTCASVSRI